MIEAVSNDDSDDLPVGSENRPSTRDTNASTLGSVPEGTGEERENMDDEISIDISRISNDVYVQDGDDFNTC